MDLDQAMHISKVNQDGTLGSTKGFLVSYALADGAYYVPAGSHLMNFAVEKGASSFYLPGLCIPMLPRKLSEDVMSLNEGVVRRALVFDIILNEVGHVLKTTCEWARVKSVWKGTYREVAEYYEAVDTSGQALGVCTAVKAEFRQTVDLLREVGLLRIELAKARHVVQYNRQGRGGITVGKTGMLEFCKARAPYISEAYNEQISLLCNSEGAKLLLELKGGTQNESVVQPIFRNQAAPSDDKIQTLLSFLPALSAAWGLDPNEFGWSPSREHLSDFLERLRAKVNRASGQSKTALSSFLSAVERTCQVTNQSADFATWTKGHFSLKLDAYARFSSPMRE